MHLDTNGERIETLKQQLTAEIAARESDFESTIQNYICVNNLKSKLKRLEVIQQILAIKKYTLVFIGTVGEGKTTAICHLFNLLGEFSTSTSKTVAGKPRTLTFTETKELLATASGRRTICEVVVKAAEQTSIEIEPYTLEEMQNLVLDFCDSLADPPEVQGEPRKAFSKEIETAIRNVIQLKKTTQASVDGDKSSPARINIDQARQEFEKSGLAGLKEAALRNANLANRTVTRLAYDRKVDERSWIKDNFVSVNDGEVSTVAIPRRITLCVSAGILSGSALSQFEAVVDTKGLDENAIQKNLEAPLERQDTICLFTTNFKDAPETNIRNLMTFYLSLKSRDYHHRFVTFVTTHKGEPEKVNGSDGNWENGTCIRRDDIQTAFRNLGLDFFPSNIIFFDALRYYLSDRNQIDKTTYTQEDVDADRAACLEAINGVIDQRHKLLLEEVESISAGFYRIKEGEMLSKQEVDALQNAVQRIQDLRDLSKRIPAFVYDEFVDNYVLYFRNTYPAWNSKHAINKRFGKYDVKNYDIFYDARVVAEGKSDEEMLKKFTREPKRELESILSELTDANEALDAFIPDLVKQVDAAYDDFITEVGTDVEAFLTNKLSNENSDFWHALISEKGKPRPRGETYTDNVCQTYRQELEADESLNVFLASKSRQHWEELVTKVLGYFGE